MARMKFMNTEIDNLTMDEALVEIDKLIRENKNAYVVTPNVDHIVQLERGGELVQVYRYADLILTDGKPLIWISKWYGTPIKEKISGSDLFPLVCKMAAEKNYKMYFLGAAEGVAAKAAENLMKKYKGLNVVGAYSPPYGFEKDEMEMAKIEKMIKDAGAETQDVNKRYEKYAAAQAWLTDSALVMPTSSSTGRPFLTRIEPFSAPFAWTGGKGKDHVIYKGMKLQDKAVTSADYNKALEKWQKEQAESNKKAQEDLKKHVK